MDTGSTPVISIKQKARKCVTNGANACFFYGCYAEKSAVADRKTAKNGSSCNTDATRKEGALAPSVLLPFLIRYELSHKSLDSLSLAYPGAVTRLLKLFRKRTIHPKTPRNVSVLFIPAILCPLFTRHFLCSPPVPPRTVSDPSEHPRDYSNYDNNFNVHLYFRTKVWYSY